MNTLPEIRLKKKDRDAIREAARVLSDRFPVERIVLYGSKARGTDDPESDVDLLVLTARELAWKERNALTDVLFDVQLAHGVVISVLVVPTREWEEGLCSVLPIHDEIDREGVPL